MKKNIFMKALFTIEKNQKLIFHQKEMIIYDVIHIMEYYKLIKSIMWKVTYNFVTCK